MRPPRLSIVLFSLAACVLFDGRAGAVDYFVATNGNDANSGTAAQPWRTVNHAVGVVQAGDTVYVRGGRYPTREAEFANSGTEQNPITLTNYPGEHVVLDGEYTAIVPGVPLPVISIDGVNHITIMGEARKPDGSHGSLHLMRGMKATIQISRRYTAKGVSIINVEFSGLVAYDNSGHIFCGLLRSGGIAANGDPASERILVQDCYFHDTVVDPVRYAAAGVFLSPGTGDLAVLNNVMVGGDLAVYFKRKAAAGARALIRGNTFLGYLSAGVGLNTDDATVEHNLFIPPLVPRRDAPWAVEVYLGNGVTACSAERNIIRHNTFVEPPNRVSQGLRLDRPKCDTGDGAYQTLIADNVITASSANVAIWLYHSGSDASETTIRHNLFHRPSAPLQGNAWILYEQQWIRVEDLPPSVSPAGNMAAQPVFVNDTNANPYLNDYRLAPGSPGKNAASDGTDMGADLSIVGRYAGSGRALVTAVSSPTSAAPGQTITFTASATGFDGTIVSYQWDFGDGASATGATRTHAYSVAGTYAARVTVRDDGGTTASATVQVTVQAFGGTNQPPSVSLSASSTSVNTGAVVTFTATASDSDGTIAAYQWNFGDGTTLGAGSASETHMYTSAGTFTATVIVTDDGGATGSDVVTVTVTDTVATGDECANWQSGHPDWIWCDDFEQGLTLATKYGANGLTTGVNPNTMTTSTTRSASGDHSLAMRWNAGEADAGSLRRNFGRQPFTPTTADVGMGPYYDEDFEEIYYRFETMIPVGFQGWPSKLTRSFSLAASNSGQWGPQAMVAHVWASAADSPYLALDPTSAVDASGNLTSTTWNDFNNFQWLGLQTADTPFVQGQWHCVEVHVRLNTPGAADGVFEMWIDGDLAATRTNLDWTGTWRDFGINGITLESLWNSGSPVEQERYLDAFVISRNRIGCRASSPSNQAPTVRASASPTAARTGQTVNFSAAASDADGTIATYSWTFGDGGSATGPTVSHSYRTTGTVRAIVTVVDDAGAAASDSVQVSVSASATPSVAVTTTPAEPRLGDAVSFAATASGFAGTITGYTWDFGDGTQTTTTGGTVSHLYPDIGQFVATVTVADNTGLRSVGQVTVTVSAPYQILGCSLQVGSPAAGAVLQAGSEVTLLWTGQTDATGAKVRLRLLAGGSPVQVIARRTDNDGTLLWEIPSDLQGRIDYQIQLYEIANASACLDVSDAFTIENASDVRPLPPGRVHAKD